ncbi:hypothetical protein ANTQUA_LOCUS2608 [Anthophora quadrimaculata]
MKRTEARLDTTTVRQEVSTATRWTPLRGSASGSSTSGGSSSGSSSTGGAGSSGDSSGTGRLQLVVHRRIRLHLAA